MSLIVDRGMVGSAAGREAGQPPNILWILCDELRRDALGCYGNPYIELRTPNIDRLAAAGTVFDDYYVNSPVCVPSRMSLLTGLSPLRTGIYHNEAAAPGYPVAASFTTLPERFAAYGYRVHDCGKEHLPAALQPWATRDPAGSGTLRELVRALEAAGTRIVRAPGSRSVIGGMVPDGMAYPSSAVTENALAAMSRGDGRPFFVRASYLQPHTPVLVPEHWAFCYRSGLFPESPIRHPGLSRFETAFADLNKGSELAGRDFQDARALYHGLVAWADDQVRVLLERLRASGLIEHTIVVFSTDHGAYLGEEGCFGKHTFAPQNQRVPLIVSAPGVASPGTRRGGLDLAPTLLGLCGVPIPESLEGRRLFADEPPPARVFGAIGYGAIQSRAFPNLAYGSYPVLGWPRRACVRTDRYRLDMNVRLDGAAPAPSDEDLFLVDRLVDPNEVENCADDPTLSSVRQALRAALLSKVASGAETPDEFVYRTFRPPAPVDTGTR